MGIKSYQDGHYWIKDSHNRFKDGQFLARKVAKIGQMDIKMIVIRMVRMGKEWPIQDVCL